MFVPVPQFCKDSPIWAECQYWSAVWEDHPEIFSLLSAIGKVLTRAVREIQHPTEWDTAVPGEGENQKVAQQQGMANELRRDGQRPWKPSYPFITMPCVFPVVLGWLLAALSADKCYLACVIVKRKDRWMDVIHTSWKHPGEIHDSVPLKAHWERSPEPGGCSSKVVVVVGSLGYWADSETQRTLLHTPLLSHLAMGSLLEIHLESQTKPNKHKKPERGVLAYVVWWHVQ